MSRFYFDIIGDEIIADADGEDLLNEHTASETACIVLSEVLRGRPFPLQDAESLSVQVRNSKGAVIYSVQARASTLEPAQTSSVSDFPGDIAR